VNSIQPRGETRLFRDCDMTGRRQMRRDARLKRAAWILNKQTQMTLAVGVTGTAFWYCSLPRVRRIRILCIQVYGRKAARHAVEAITCLLPCLEVLFVFMCLFIDLSVLYRAYILYEYHFGFCILSDPYFTHFLESKDGGLKWKSWLSICLWCGIGA
jgi:hypothetical protein